MAKKKTAEEKKYTELLSLYEKYNKHYYDNDAPLVDDAVYDDLVREIKLMEESHPSLLKTGSITEKVGGEAAAKFAPVKHDPPMLSLGNILTVEELHDFHDRCLRLGGSLFLEYSAELKYDGLAVEIVYQDGKLVQASTRGDGETGEDITENIKVIDDIPHALSGKTYPSYLTVRGEVFLTHENFEAINRARESDGETLFANPRNAAAGSLRQLDTNIVSKRKLSAVLYGIGKSEGYEISNQRDLYSRFKEWGLPLSPFFAFGSCDDVNEFFTQWNENRYTLGFDIDGVVVKVSDFSLRTEMGVTSKAPRWAVAWKFPSREAVTIIESVEHSLGRSGVITPVANLKPINIGGVLVKRATLHNYKEIERLNVRVGDHVKVIRAGDVIPKIIEVIQHSRTGNETDIVIPSICSSCGKEVTQEDIFIRCNNPACPGKNFEQLLFFVSKDGMDIEFFGPELVKRLHDKGMLKDQSDIFTLNKEKLLQLERMGDILADKILASIESRRNIDLAHFLRSLGIRNIGDHAAKVLSKWAGTLERLMGASLDDLTSIHEIGPVVAECVVSYFSDKTNTSMIDRMMSHGLVVLQHESSDQTHVPFAGKIFVFTGGLELYTREKAEEIVERYGGRASGSVSKKTSYVIAGPGAGSKMDKAKELGITVMDEQGFKNLLIEAGIDE